ncbi:MULTISPECIES: DUF4157 domain-containing protein [Lysobacter]|uniref:DUF4157 domain-containing protein n=1 Tax=Lysobacter firmicutimachus TaxID=1792846 RepID=A0ABU8D2T4_9GAMM|nr:DUF4157 domain-containing protein [Lysobacter antibioticus]
MRTKTAAKEASGHASKSFFSPHRASAASFFAPMIQAKCASCEAEETAKLKEEGPPDLQAKCDACDHEPPKLQRRDAPVQAKLSLGTPGDRFEQEADQMADTVMRMPDPAAPMQVSSTAGAGVQRDSAESCSAKDEPPEPGEINEETEDIDLVNPKETPVSPKREGGDSAAPADLESRIDAAKGSGTALPPDTRDFMESRFGHDFSQVKIHTGAASAAMNRDIHSHAFTSGTDIHFAPGQYRPDTDSGKHLLAHELTHVVQQTGSRGGDGAIQQMASRRQISRAGSNYETKWYQNTSYVSGKATHGIIERLLRESDAALVTEAAIPGADRFAPGMNKVGVADLYMSTPAKTVSGVKAYKEAETEHEIVSMDKPSSKFLGTQPAVASAPTRPDRKKGVRGWKGDFPSHIWLGELKPWNAGKLAAGVAQLDSYALGYNAFVKRVNQLSGGKTRGSISFDRLKLKLPGFLDFDNWDAQHKIGSPKTEYGDRRLWVAYVGGGVYLYKDLAKGLDTPPDEYFTKHLAEMRELKKSMTDSHPHPGKMASPKTIAAPAPVVSRAPSGAATRHIQRHTKDRPDSYWKERGAAWEKKRGAWGGDFRKFLDSKLSGHRDKVKFEKRIGKAGGKLSGTGEKEVREYKQLMFWSGRAGKYLGKVRFMLGSAWDKVIGVFERKKKPMEDVRTKVQGVKAGGMTKIGWASKLLTVVVSACKVAFTAFITESFNFFADCFHSAMDKLVERFNEELNESFGDEICRARKSFEESKEKLETEWGDVIRQLEALVTAVQDAKRWMDIATTAVDLIRIGVQIVSCVSPPALGCLWGLVAQLGIGAMVSIVIGTDWFNREIVTPNVRELLRTHIAPTYQKLINNVLGPNLSKYHCHIADDAIPAMKFEAKGGIADNSDAMRAHRDQWEKEFEPQILKDLQTVFGKPGGKAVTKEEMLDLLKRIKDSGLSMQEFKDRQTARALLEQARESKTGKLNLEDAKREAVKKDPPSPKPEVERKIDYPHAREQNVVYKKIRGWEPTLFIAKPGIKADSDEFANAIYDMQGKLGMKQDGIAGDATLLAFYDKNGKKKDFFYKETVAALEKQKADREKAAKERAAKEKAAQDKVDADKQYAQATKGLDPSVKVVKAHEVVPANKDWIVPKGIGVQIVNFWSYIEWSKNPLNFDVPKPPAFVDLDIVVDGKHVYRVLNVAVNRLYVTKGFGVGLCRWNANLELLDGIRLDTSNGVVQLYHTLWCLSDDYSVP